MGSDTRVAGNETANRSLGFRPSALAAVGSVERQETSTKRARRMVGVNVQPWVFMLTILPALSGEPDLRPAVSAPHLLDTLHGVLAPGTALGDLFDGSAKVLLLDGCALFELEFDDMGTVRALQALGVDRKLEVRATGLAGKDPGLGLVDLPARSVAAELGRGL